MARHCEAHEEGPSHNAEKCQAAIGLPGRLAPHLLQMAIFSTFPVSDTPSGTLRARLLKKIARIKKFVERRDYFPSRIVENLLLERPVIASLRRERSYYDRALCESSRGVRISPESLWNPVGASNARKMGVYKQ